MSNIVGPQKEIWNWTGLFGFDGLGLQMSHILHEGKLPSVVIFDGRDAIGKSRLAASFAAMHFCHQGNACGTCPECLAVLNNNHPEILMIKSNELSIKREDAGFIQEHLANAPQLDLYPQSRCPARLVVIADCDRLTVQATNQLLKTFEEPPQYVRIFLTTNRYDALLATLKSRAMRWRMMPPPIEESVRWLKSLAVDDGLSLSDDELKTLLFRNGLSPGKALSTMRSQQIESRDLWRDTMGLLKAQDLMQAQDAIQKLAGYKQLAASTWLRLVELVLNEYYRQALLKPSLATKDPTCIGIWRRRQCLDKIRSLADRGRIALNYQMCVESIAYSGLGLGHDL